MTDLTRRRVLLAAGGTCAATLAGCTGDGGDGNGGDGADDGGDDRDGANGQDDGSGATDGASDGGGASDGDGSNGQSGADENDTPSGDLDLREANVTGVAVEQSGDASRLSVTLYHDVRKSRGDFRSPSEIFDF